jgi:hypothetical protein
MIALKKRKILFLLGGWLYSWPNGYWHTNKFGEGEMASDRLRVEAAYLFWKHNQDFIIMPSGRQGRLSEIVPSDVFISGVIKKELVELGVKSENIIEEDKSGSTVEQLKELVNIIQKYEPKEILVLSNEWHLPRTQAMINFHPALLLLKKKSNFKLLSAEDVLLKYDKIKWNDIIEKNRKSPEVLRNIEMEQNGVKQIKNGTYKFTS